MRWGWERPFRWVEGGRSARRKTTLLMISFLAPFINVTDHLPPGVPQGGQKHQWTQHCHRPQVDCGQLVQGVCQVVPVTDGESEIVRVKRTHAVLFVFRSLK